MRATLKITDQLYHEAKAKAELEEITLAMFVEEELRVRLVKHLHSSTEHSFRIYATEQKDPRSWELISKIAENEQKERDNVKLELGR